LRFSLPLLATLRALQMSHLYLGLEYPYGRHVYRQGERQSCKHFVAQIDLFNARAINVLRIRFGNMEKSRAI